jgi:hypothetical protein
MFLTTIAKVSLAFGIVVALATSSAALMGYYPLNELNNPSIATTVADASGGAHDGIVTSDAIPPGTGAVEGIASANTGLYQTAYNFSTASTELDYVDINTTFTFLTRDGALSYAAWIKPSATQDFQLPTFIGTPGSAFDFRIAQPASGPGWNLRLQSGNSAAGVATTATIPSDVWTHVAVTKEAYNATTNPSPAVNFYINGLLAESGTVGRAGSGTSTKRLFIATGALATEYYNGGVDEVYVYNEVLDAATIAGLAGVAVPEPTAIVLVGIGLIGLFGRHPRKRWNE